MNPHILMVIDHQLNPGKYTKEQLEDNRKSAKAAYTDAAYDAAYAAAYSAAYASYSTYWLNKYFMRSGENKQDYVDKINKDNKQ